MDITDVDLNLLVVFDALLRNRSVSGAARELKMSQPATSFALNRLRTMFGEPLFVRTSRGIHPTPYAESLASPLESILDRIRADLLQQQTFDPATEDLDCFERWRLVRGLRSKTEASGGQQKRGALVHSRTSIGPRCRQRRVIYGCRKRYAALTQSGRSLTPIYVADQ